MYHDQVYLIDGLDHNTEAVTEIKVESLDELCELFFYQHQQRISSSVIQSLKFFMMIKSFGIKKQDLLTYWCGHCGIRAHSSIMIECQKIIALPEEIIILAHEKKLSFKQCLNLTLYPHDLLLLVFQLKEGYSLSTAVFEELVSSIYAISQRKKKNFNHILKEAQENIDLKNPSAALDRLRSTIKAEKYPILTQHNQRIADAIQDLDLTIPIKWDQTLENKYLSLDLHITHIEQLKPLLDLLKEKEVDIGRILDQL